MRLVPFVALVFIAGCYSQPGAGQEPPPDVLAFARESVVMLEAQEFDRLVRRLAPQPVPAGTAAELERMASVLPSDATGAMRLVAFVHDPTYETTDLAFAVGPDNAPTLARISVQGTQGGLAVGGLFVEPLNAPLSDVMTMSWRGKGPTHYVITAVAIIVPVSIIGTLVTCLRARMLSRKWLWAMAILFGVGQVTLNWHTGEVAVRLFHLQLLGAGYMVLMGNSPIVWPLLISVSLPVGAVAFHARLWRARRTATTAV